MKKKLIALFMICCFIFVPLVGCATINYQQSFEPDNDSMGDGYFTTVKQWGGASFIYRIVYANDTKVMYFVMSGNTRSGITPLYNADGTLQIYCDE